MGDDLAEVPNVEQHFKLTYPCICPNPACGNRKEWQLLLDQSTFVDWQKVRVQEYNDEVPPGSLPRTLDVIVRNSSVERARAGDKCLFTGMLLAVPDVSVLTAPGDKTARQCWHITRPIDDRSSPEPL